MLHFIMMMGVATLSHAYPSGAPPLACVTLLPRHVGAVPQTSSSPYSITVSHQTYSPGNPLKVRIEGAQFAAFILQARTVSTNDSTGVFQQPAGTRAMSCEDNGDTLTHTSPDPKSNLEVLWTPPSQNVGDIKILGTVAESKFRYWGVLTSPVLKYATPGSRQDVLGNAGVSVQTSTLVLASAAATLLLRLQ